MVISKLGVTKKRLLIIESLNQGPTVNYLSDRIEKYKGKVHWFPLRKNISDAKRRKAEIIVWDYLCKGTKYDFHSIFKQIFSKVSVDAAQLFCSELVQISWEKAKIIKEQDHALNPGELIELPCLNESVLLKV